MLAFPSMLLPAAEEAGMKVPTYEEIDDYNPEDFPHFHVFCLVQLGRRMNNLGEHWDNAKVVAAIPNDDIRLVTIDSLIDSGLSWAS